MSSFNLVQIVPSLNSGGVERGTVDVANFLAEKKIKNFIITSGGNMIKELNDNFVHVHQLPCLLYTSPSPRDATLSRMPSSA